MIALKAGVKLSGVRPEIVLAIMVARSIFYDLVVTSVTEDAPGRVSGSLHPVGLAFDFRLQHLPVTERQADRLGEALGSEFDVVFSGSHIHVEFQP